MNKPKSGAGSKLPSRSNSKGPDSARGHPKVKDNSRASLLEADKDKSVHKEIRDSASNARMKDAAKGQGPGLEKMKAERLGNDVYKNLIQVDLH